MGYLPRAMNVASGRLECRLLSDCKWQPGVDPREGQGGTCPPQPQVIFTDIILHRRALFYKFADITVMFLSRDSLYWTYITSRFSYDNKTIYSPNDDVRGSAGRVHPSASPSRLHPRTGCHCGPFRWLWSTQTAFCILRQK